MNKELMKVKTKIYKRQMQKAINAWDGVSDEAKANTRKYSTEEIEAVGETVEVAREYMKQDIFTEKDFNDIDLLSGVGNAIYLNHYAKSTLKVCVPLLVLGLIGLGILAFIL